MLHFRMVVIFFNSEYAMEEWKARLHPDNNPDVKRYFPLIAAVSSKALAVRAREIFGKEYIEQIFFPKREETPEAVLRAIVSAVNRAKAIDKSSIYENL